MLRSRKQLALVAGLLGGLLGSGWPQVAAAQSRAARQALDSVKAAYHLPALLAAVIEPGHIRYVYGGVKRLGQPDTVKRTDYFHLASETKGVTSLLAAKLIAQGKLRWESRLLEVVPELRSSALAAYANVTLDELLSHRAGVQPYTQGAEYESLPIFTGSVSARRLQFAKAVLQQPPAVRAAGQEYTYSNAGYVLAALMLEQVSHHSWEALVARTFHHFRLRYLLGFPNRHDPQQPWGHWLQTPTDTVLTALAPTNPYQLFDYMAPAGDLSMPILDFARLVQRHLRGLLGRGRYLAPASYQRLHFGKPTYAYGWGVSALADGSPVSFHNGSAGSFFAYAVLYPRQRVAFVVLTNCGGTAAEQGSYALRRRLKQLYLQGQL